MKTRQNKQYMKMSHKRILWRISFLYSPHLKHSAPSSICFLIIERGLWDWHDRVGMGILEVSFFNFFSFVNFGPLPALRGPKFWTAWQRNSDRWKLFYRLWQELTPCLSYSPSPHLFLFFSSLFIFFLFSVSFHWS
jgi:hypothetical protein